MASERPFDNFAEQYLHPTALHAITPLLLRDRVDFKHKLWPANPIQNAVRLCDVQKAFTI